MGLSSPPSIEPVSYIDITRTLCFAALIATFVFGQAHAEAWRAINGTSESATFVELDGRAKTQEGIRIWLVSISAQAHAPVMGLFGKDVQIERALREIDCSASRVRILQDTYFTRDLESRGEFNPPSPHWSYVAPSTLGETVQKVACGAKELPTMGPPFATMASAINDYFGWVAKQ